MPSLPTGTVTFLFSDIEGSTRLWQGYRALIYMESGLPDQRFGGTIYHKCREMKV